MIGGGGRNKADHSPPHTQPKIRMSGALPPVTALIMEYTGKTLTLPFMYSNSRDTQCKVKKVYSFCLMVEASDHGYVLHTRRTHVTRYRIRYDMM
jgi:hypothetical protein